MQVKTQLSHDVSLLKQLVDEQQHRIEYLENQLLLLRHHRFGKSSESFSPDQVQLFGIDEENSKELESLSQEKFSVKPHSRRKKSRIILDKSTPVEGIVID